MSYSFTRAEAEARPAHGPWNEAQESTANPVSTGRQESNRKVKARSWPVRAIVLIQGILFLGHALVFFTWTAFWPMSKSADWVFGSALLVLSLTFMAASLLGFRFWNPAVSGFYKLAASWLGVLNFLFWAAILCWLIDVPLRMVDTSGELNARRWIAVSFFGVALLISLYGFINARNIRERRLTVTLPNLPPSWRGRTALLVSDIHLGHVNGASFSRRIASLANRLKPSVVFIAGDLFDGSRIDADEVTAPLFEMNPQYGVYFCGGNHEDYGDAEGYTRALARGGIRVLENQRVDLDGLQVIGVSYAASVVPMRLRSFLDSLRLAGGPASILLNHVPHRLPIVEQAGVSLQLSGHTHGGQIVPFTWIARRTFREFTYGLQRYRRLQVLTSSGVGTWGPPMRVGSKPEVVLITFA